MDINFIIQISYFVAAVLFIFGLKRMSMPATARGGIIWAGAGMVLATLVTFLEPGLGNFGLMIVAIVSSSILAWYSGKKVEMTDMPQMIALYNGMGGGAAAAIAAVGLIKGQATGIPHIVEVTVAVIGTVAFSGSLIAYAKLQGIMRKTLRFPGLHYINLVTLLVIIGIGYQLVVSHDQDVVVMLAIFFVLSLVFGMAITAPIGGADMPVVISLFNALTGLAVGFEGYVLNNPAMMIAGIVVGASGTLLTQLMAKAMNRPISNVLFSGFGDTGGEAEGGAQGTMKEIEGYDAAVSMAYAQKVIIVPGYGMAVGQAQHKVWELTEILEKNDVEVLFAIHPVAGRMPGHMNVLLAEAGVPYEKILDLDEINPQFPAADVALVIGANDVVNPAARNNKSSPIYGMPILDADKAQNCIVIKRGKGAGFSGIQNELFFADNTKMLYGDAQKAVGELIAGVKSLAE